MRYFLASNSVSNVAITFSAILSMKSPMSVVLITRQTFCPSGFDVSRIKYLSTSISSVFVSFVNRVKGYCQRTAVTNSGKKINRLVGDCCRNDDTKRGDNQKHNVEEFT